MKQIKIKKQRNGRKLPKGNRGNAFKSVAGSEKSNNRRIVRGNDDVNSTKIGAGSVVARRNLPMETLHKRNHRSNTVIGYKI